jgi:small subunit ribosomal protein S8
VDVPASKLKAEIARILKEEGFIANYKVADEEGKRTIKIYLKYGPDSQPVISRIARISRPGRRVYVGQKEIPRVLGGMGINILTTPRGVMTGRTAYRERVGGEILCEVW